MYLLVKIVEFLGQVIGDFAESMLSHMKGRRNSGKYIST
jgi:hypothetical protein